MNKPNPQDLYLLQKGSAWYVSIEVPKKLRVLVGKRRITRALDTRDVGVARKTKGKVVDAIWAEIDTAAARHHAASQGVRAEVVQEAVAWRSHLRGLASEVVEEKAEEVEAKHGAEMARVWHGVATGEETPLEAHVEAWLAGSTYTEKTKGDHRYAIRQLVAWLGDGPTVERVTGKMAVRFRDQELVGKGVHFKTANRMLSSLRTYWRWMGRSEYLGEDWKNPWADKSLPKPKARSADDRERPFTDEEMKTLLAGDHWVSREDLEVLLLGALTGGRREELFQMKVRHTRGGVFALGRKTEDSIRTVPVHSGLAGLLEKLTAGRGDDDWLVLPEEAAGRDGERGTSFTKRFATYRRRMGVDDMEGQGGGRRRSRVNFHSVRRWFATKCEQAGIAEHLTMRVLGHKVTGMSYGVYSGGASLEQMRSVVEAVKLPR